MSLEKEKQKEEWQLTVTDFGMALNIKSQSNDILEFYTCNNAIRIRSNLKGFLNNIEKVSYKIENFEALKMMIRLEQLLSKPITLYYSFSEEKK